MPPVTPVIASGNPFFNLTRTLATEENLLAQTSNQQTALLNNVITGQGQAPTFLDFVRNQSGIGLARTFKEGWIKEIKDFIKSLAELLKIGT